VIRGASSSGMSRPGSGVPDSDMQVAFATIPTPSHYLCRGDANQDGGAHVDATPSKKTAELIDGVGNFATVQHGKVISRKLDNQHFPLLRQFAYEALASPDVTRKR
jgi:hypothetical protein